MVHKFAGRRDPNLDFKVFNVKYLETVTR